MLSLACLAPALAYLTTTSWTLGYVRRVWPGFNDLLGLGPGQLPGALYAGNDQGLSVSLQSQVLVARWTKHLSQGGPGYPRYGALREALYRGRRARVNDLVRRFVREQRPSSLWRHRIGDLCLHPLWGSAIAAALLYLFIYQFVGIFVAGHVVGLTEETVMQGHWEPFVRGLGGRWFGWTVAESGAVATGLVPAVGTILVGDDGPSARCLRLGQPARAAPARR